MHRDHPTWASRRRLNASSVTSWQMVTAASEADATLDASGEVIVDADDENDEPLEKKISEGAMLAFSSRSWPVVDDADELG